MMSETGRLQGVADEGGFWPAFDSNEAALDALVGAIERAGFTPGDEVSISLDIASSEFYRDGAYRLALKGLVLDSDAMSAMLIDWLDRYPIVSIEDPLAEHDAAGFTRFTKAVGHRVQIVGDDFLVTDAARLRRAEDVAKRGSAVGRTELFDRLLVFGHFERLDRQGHATGGLVDIGHLSVETVGIPCGQDQRCPRSQAPRKLDTDLTAAAQN